MGFSPLGLLIALAVLAPNLVLVIARPADGSPPDPGTPAVFTGLERVGQIGCLTLLAASRDGIRVASVNVWSTLMILSLATYWGLWGRYLMTGRTVAALFRPLGFVPVPMAVFPTLAFASAALWIRSPWLAMVTADFAVGHLTNSWHSYCAIT